MIWRETSSTFNQASFAPQSVQIPGPHPLGAMVQQAEGREMQLVRAYVDYPCHNLLGPDEI